MSAYKLGIVKNFAGTNTVKVTFEIVRVHKLLKKHLRLQKSCLVRINDGSKISIGDTIKFAPSKRFSTSVSFVKV